MMAIMIMYIEILTPVLLNVNDSNYYKEVLLEMRIIKM